MIPVAPAKDQYCGWIVSPKVSTKKLFGPASLLDNRVIIYPCSRFGCFVYCACFVCRMIYQEKIKAKQYSRDELLLDHTTYHGAYHKACEYCCEIFKIFPCFQFIVVSRKWINNEESQLVSHSMQKFSHVDKKLPGKTKNDFKSCSLCEAQFTRASDQLRHFKAVHMEESFCCDICDKKYNRRDNLTAHIEEVHKNCSGEFVCEDCNTEFRSYVNFKRHRLTKNEVKCKICGEVYCSSKVLNLHVKKEHVLKCEDCQTSFTRKSSLISHKMRT